MLSKPEQRCLVPFTRFAEPKPNAGREEIWFSVTGTPVAAFSGIWRPSTDADVFAFLTCEPPPLIKPYHPNAMRVILPSEAYKTLMAGAPADTPAYTFTSQLMSILG